MTLRRCTEAMQKARVYREAARQIDAGDHDCGDGKTQGACDVLGNTYVSTIHRPDLAATFKDVFVAGEFYLMDDVCDDPEETRQVRILALCFMAAMAEAGDAE